MSKQQIPEGVIDVKEGEEPPEGYVPYRDMMQNAYTDVLQHQREEAKQAGAAPRQQILGVTVDDAREVAQMLVTESPEQTARLMAGVAWLVLNQSDVVDRIGTAVQDSIVFMNNAAGQLNTRNYAVTREPTKVTNLRLDYHGRTGDLTDDSQVFGFKFSLFGPASLEELQAGPDAFTAKQELDRVSYYHFIHQLSGFEVGNEPATFYATFSISDQDPFFASERAMNGSNPKPEVSQEGTLKVNTSLN